MSSTIYLSQVFGLYFFIVGIVVMIRKTYIMPVFGAFVEERLTRLILACFELLAGLFLIVSHFNFDTFAAGTISTLGLLAVAESVFYLAAPDSIVDKFIKCFNVKTWYIFGGLFSSVLGVYLICFGFGL